MPLTFITARSAPRDVGALGFGVFSDGPLPRAIGVGRATLQALGFEGKVGQTCALPSSNGTVTFVVGLGPRGDMNEAVLRKAAAALARAASRQASLATGLLEQAGVDAERGAQAIVEGMVLASYRFGRYKKDPQAPKLETVTLTVGSDRAEAALAGIRRGEAVAGAVEVARDLVNEPGGRLNARDVADRAVEIATKAGLEVEVLDEDGIAEQRLAGLLNVNRGSREPARLIKLRYVPRGRAAGTVALVGKGITFDSGGLSLKTTEGMMTMKVDMSGAAAVLATMSVLPVLKPRARVHAYLCCTDNMPGDNAMKPGDIITYRNGTTVEVLNTDAEGRLVLADGLQLAVEEGADAIVDIATLTGACIGALGHKIAGVMGNNQAWVDQVLAAGARADESLWQLPLPDEYRKTLDSEIADLKNIGTTSGMGVSGGGALTAGLFLKEFVGDKPWAHLDIAGPARSEADEGLYAKGGTGFGVRTLVELLQGFRKP